MCSFYCAVQLKPSTYSSPSTNFNYQVITNLTEPPYFKQIFLQTNNAQTGWHIAYAQTRVDWQAFIMTDKQSCNSGLGQY